MSLLKAILKFRLSIFAVLLISITFIFVKFRQVGTVEPFIRDSYALSWDNYGYYLHLPALIIHHDIGIENKVWIDSLNTKYQKDRPFYQVMPGQKNRLVNVYPLGFSIFNLPFFLVGHLFAKLSDYPADGLSPPYQWSLICSALFFGILGFHFLRKLLLRYFSDRLSALLMLLIGVGTNLYYYATYECVFPHIFLFTADTFLILLTIKWHERLEKKTALYIGMLLGLITITRPSEIVWVLIPLFWNVSGWKSFKEKIVLFLQNKISVLLLVLGMLAVGSLQLFYWKYTSGNWFSFNHTEGFDFASPFTLKVLFSFKKGWLLYTPMMILALCGFVVLYKRARNLFVPFFLFFLANLWFISSWECWWYAGTFGQRAFVQSYGLMAIPLGFFLQSAFAKNATKYIALSLAGFFLVLNQFQTWQLKVGIIHNELMSEPYYWKVFGRMEAKEEWKLLLEDDRGNLPPLDSAGTGYMKKTIFFNDFENSASINDILICDTIGYKSKKSELLVESHVYSVGFKKSFDSITSSPYIRARLYADVFLPADFTTNPTNLSFTMEGRRGQSYSFVSMMIDSSMAKPNTWCRVHLDYITPHILHEHDKLLAFIWNQGGAKVYVDNIEVVIYEPKVP